MVNQIIQRTQAGQAIEDLIIEIVATFFLLRAEGMRIGVVSSSGEGYWSVLRLLKVNGSQTVPQLARYRYVPRQSVQKLANEMLNDGVIEFLNNPAHQRSMTRTWVTITLEHGITTPIQEGSSEETIMQVG